MINDILINVGYDDLTRPNLYNYNIEPNWNLISKTNITTLLGNNLGNFKINTVNYFIDNNIDFIYPILLFDEKLFQNYGTIEFNFDLVKSIQNKKCKIVFVYILEGYFNNDGVDFINKLCQKYNFDNENILLITSNLKDVNGNNFNLFQYNYFGNHFQFLEFSKLDQLKVNIFKNSFNKFLNNYNKLHFLCFNGIPRLNRVLMFNELNNNEKLRGKSITTLRGEDKNYYFDIVNWENQTLSSGAHLNVKAHLDCFVNIVTETLFDTQSIFLTEKTYKPIYLCQPFIIFGNPYSLKKLKELGYMTFGKWWDESYDDETDINKRFEKIVVLLEKIAEWDMDKCFEIKKEMKETLIHNYKRMFDTTEITELLLVLKCENKPKNKQNLI
jgi:hypothetical protein